MKCQDSRCRDDRSATTRKNDPKRARASSNTKSNPAVAIQRSAGNQAAQAVLSDRGREDSRGGRERSPSERSGPTLTIGDPNARYEREAERVAERVMRADESVSTASTSSDAGPARIQRMCSRCRRRYEQGKPLNCEECEQELQRSEAAQRKPSVHGRVTDRIRSLRGGGSRLDEDVRSFFEPRFGRDFSDVRVHTGGRADAVARAVNATAFTLGRDVVFRSGAYQPGTAGGRRLLAHELTHVVQQRGNRPRGGGSGGEAAEGSRVSRTPATIQRACANGTWQFECDGCSVPPEHQDKVADKDNPTGHPETVFGHESADGLCKDEHDAPCDNHDRCYQTCASTRTADGWEYDWDHKDRCDEVFYHEMQAVCAAAGDPEGPELVAWWNPNCSTYARVYYEAVSWGGGDAFRRRQREACECQEREPTKPDPEPEDEGPTELPVTKITANVYTVQRGDTLWEIAEREYGDGRKWPVIYEKNKKGPENPNGIEDPDLIFPGQRLIIPSKSEAEAFDRSEHRRPGHVPSR